MVAKTLLVAFTLSEVLASEPCPADIVSKTVSSTGEIEDAEDVATLDVVSMLQVSVTQHFHRGGSNSSKSKHAVPHINATDGAFQFPLTSARKEVADHVIVDEGSPQNIKTDEQVEYTGTDNDCIGPSPCQPQASPFSNGTTGSVQQPEEQVEHTGIEKSETRSGPISVRSDPKEKLELQELALFIEALAEEFVHDFISKLRSAFHTVWTSFSCLILPSKQHGTGGGYLEGDARLRSFVAYFEVVVVGLVAAVSLSTQRKLWRLPHLQTVEVHLVLSLAFLSVFARIVAHPSWCLALTLGLRYFVEGYMLLVALYVLPSTLGCCMAEAQVREQRRAAEHFVLEGGGFERDSSKTTPPLLDVAIVQQEKQPEIQAFPSSLPPMPSLLAVVLCVVRPLLGIVCAMVEHHQPLAMTICFWLNTWLIVFGLMLTAGLVIDTFSQIAQYVPTCEIVALSVGLLPLLGAMQDVALCGSLNSGAVSYAGMMYLHEVTGMTIFVMYMVSQGAHFPTEKLLCVDDVEEVSGWQRWLQEVLNPGCVLKSLKPRKAIKDIDAEKTVNDERFKQSANHEFHSISCTHDSA